MDVNTAYKIIRTYKHREFYFIPEIMKDIEISMYIGDFKEKRVYYIHGTGKKSNIK